jgi:hypothetical protein
MAAAYGDHPPEGGISHGGKSLGSRPTAEDLTAYHLKVAGPPSLIIP